MRKCLVFVALLLVSQLNYIKAQNLFNVPDTVCIRQPVKITPNVSASTYYWGFCSGYMLNAPVQTNLGIDTNLFKPGAIVVERDGQNYFGFVANTATNTLVQLNYGRSLGNKPITTVIGSMNNTMPKDAAKLFLTKDSTGNWFLFITGGTTPTNSTIARVDFGKSLSNLNPSSVNFGNLGGVLNAPRGLFIQNAGGSYVGFLANQMDNKLIRLDFGNNLSITPNVTDMGASFGFGTPSDMIPVYDNGFWFAFATNLGNNLLTRLVFGTSLNNIPTGSFLGLIGDPMKGPSSLTFARDCDAFYFYVTNSLANSVTRIDVSNLLSAQFRGTEYTVANALNTPNSITKIVRERDNLFCFVANVGDNSLSSVVFAQCTTASVTSSTATNPPVYSYQQPARYNVYLAVDEGLPTMRVQCQQIVVLPIPQLTISQDTIICQGDSILLSVRSQKGLSFSWNSQYNISPKRDSFDVKVWPEFATDYRVVIPYANGCVVDTDVYVDVSKIKADAGADRILSDGAKTMLGGPGTTEGNQFTYTWLPNQFINDISSPNPVVNPPYDFTYYLEVRNNFGCYAIDTVVVRVTCNDLNLPNAFVPESSNPQSNRFGLLNHQIMKLNYFKVFDRWGKLVFETTDVTKQWDGRINGNAAPMGVYVWEADGFCVENKRFKRNGNVTLIR
ncbi:MAG: gliding motility-associated C-terminal domain-containing protein [Bacteroidetes bacterium]|nr:gliding motility-associated C-terminal domain-containing protein [Bacteroidota bacterium]